MIAMPTSSRWTVLVAGEHTGGRMSVVETFERQGSEPPRHVHTREDEWIYVLDGHVTFNLDGEWIDGPAGSWVFLPRGSEHCYAVLSGVARLLILLSPAGLESSHRDALLPDSADDDTQAVERLVTIAARYGISITGPAA